VQGRKKRTLQVLREFDNEATALAAEYSVLVLQTDYGWIPQVQEVRSKSVFVQIVLIDLKFDRVRILVAIPLIVHGYDTAIDVRIVVENRAGKVSRKGGDTTLSW
jgi:hypothetical protein